MSYTAKSLEEIAAMFDVRAEEAYTLAKRAADCVAAASYRGESVGWKDAAHILRRTTLTEPCHMETPAQAIEAMRDAP